MVPGRGRYNFVVHCNCADASRAPGVDRSASVLHVRHGLRLLVRAVVSCQCLSADWALLRSSDLDFRFTAGREWRATRTLISIMVGAEVAESDSDSAPLAGRLTRRTAQAASASAIKVPLTASAGRQHARFCSGWHDNASTNSGIQHEPESRPAAASLVAC